jgi:hypothetical protein
MKGLAIKGKISIKQAEYKVLFSDMLKDFVDMPVSTQLTMLDDLIANISKVNGPDMKLTDLYRLQSSMQTMLNQINSKIADVKSL